MSDPTRPFGLEDLERQVAIGQVALDPSGDLVAYTRRTVVDGRDRIDLWSVPYTGGEPRRLTDGPSLDTTPRFSPGGGLIAFLSGEPDGSSQVHVMTADGGDSRKLTSFPHGAADAVWAADGQSLIALAEDEHAPGDVRVAEKGEPTAQVIDRIDWRNDDEGTPMRRPRHLHRVPLDGGEPERLTSGEWSASRPAVAGDGSILLLADPRPRADLDPNPQVYRLGAAGLVEPVTGLAGGVAVFTPAADGGLLCVGWPRERRLWIELCPPKMRVNLARP